MPCFHGCQKFRLVVPLGMWLFLWTFITDIYFAWRQQCAKSFGSDNLSRVKALSFPEPARVQCLFSEKSMVSGIQTWVFLQFVVSWLVGSRACTPSRCFDLNFYASFTVPTPVATNIHTNSHHHHNNTTQTTLEYYFVFRVNWYRYTNHDNNNNNENHTGSRCLFLLGAGCLSTRYVL